ncbi:MAG: LysM peptidoglycan-binding domain-containing protein [Myxococcales bacterium]|nr:LysM peptidoglycan-binding domain-containing protein [Myxococcales bacterium]
MELEKATLHNENTGEAVPVLFNPEEYTVKRGVNYASLPVVGLSGPITQFVHGEATTLEMELFLDTREAHEHNRRVVNQAGDDVRKLVDRIVGLMNIDPATHAPPILLFVWGSLSFNCVLTSATQQFVLFLADGTPVRARLQVSFSEYRNVDREAKEVKRETSDYTKSYVVGEGDTLAGIGAREYGRPTLWRPIALHNGLDRPRDLKVGQRLAIPRLPYRDPSTGEIYE